VIDGKIRGGPPDHDRAASQAEATAAILAPAVDAGPLLAGYGVLVETPQGKLTRRLYLSLHAATEAVGRARARGQVARAVLLHFSPADEAADRDRWSA